MPGPLRGVRILDLTHVLNGPFCTMLLAHMGAEVLKIEYGSGDRYRHSWMPPDAKRDGYEFLMVNSNKKGITLNLKHEKAKEIFCELVKKSDVVVENFSLGVMERLGLGYETLREVNPRVIYATSKGYGESGPYSHVRANASTIMATSGWQNAAHELAHKPGIRALGIGDEAAGVSLALGICAALYARERTGRGQKIEVAMQEALMGFMVSSFHTYFENRPVAQPPKQCADGYYAFHLPDLPDELWRRLATAMGRPELPEDPRYASAKARRQNYHELEELVSEWVRGKTRRELWEALSALGLPSGPVLSLGELMKDPHLQERKAFVEIEHSQAGTIKVLAPWARFSETPSAITRAAPLVGQDNVEVYGELLGLSAEEVRRLAREGVI
ncbi:MAG: CoA transferase [Deltaproteobacteria bacterium]|nr:CoA transferase [Deltaproteobacteria bacterium]